LVSFAEGRPWRRSWGAGARLQASGVTRLANIIRLTLSELSGLFMIQQLTLGTGTAKNTSAASSRQAKPD